MSVAPKVGMSIRKKATLRDECGKKTQHQHTNNKQRTGSQRPKRIMEKLIDTHFMCYFIRNG